MVIQTLPTEIILGEYLAKHFDSKFEWGVFDCVLFAANWAELATGHNYLEGVPLWTNEREALRTLAELGGIEAVVDARLERINPHRAKDGSIALRERTLCIFNGEYILGPGVDRLLTFDRMEAKCAWQLP